MEREICAILMLVVFLVLAVTLAVRSETQIKEHEKFINEIKERYKVNQKHENK